VTMPRRCAQLLPRLRLMFPRYPSPPLELRMSRTPLPVQHLADVIALTCYHRPLLLASTTSLGRRGNTATVEHLAPRLPGLQVLAVGTYRDTEVPHHLLARPLRTCFEAPAE